MAKGIKLKQLLASLIIKHVILQVRYHDYASSAEYCLLEDFSPTCPQDSIILITSARYGRMQLGRCLSRDYHLGCFADVTIQLDHLCSGRRHCHLSIPEPHLLKLVSCPSDLVSYLEADYECIKVNSFDTQACHVTGRDPPPTLLTSPSGFITSHHFLSSGFLPSTSGIKYPSPVLDFPVFPSSLSSSSSSSSSLPLKHGEDHVISFTSSTANNCKWIIVCLPGQRSTMTLYNLHSAREVDPRSARELQQPRRSNEFPTIPQYSFQLNGESNHYHHYQHHHHHQRRHDRDRSERSADVEQQQQQQQQQKRRQLNSTIDNQVVSCNGFYAVITEHEITQERFVGMITWINNINNNINNINNINNNININNNSKTVDDNREVINREFLLSGKRKIVCLRETRIALLHATEGKSVSLVVHLRDFQGRPQQTTNNNNENNNILSSYNDIDFAAHNDNNKIMYLLKYSVHGCAKVVTPSEAEVVRYVDGFDVSCNVTYAQPVTWSFKCSRNFWLERDGTILDVLHPPWSRCTFHSSKAKEIPLESQQSVYLSRVFGYLRGHETTAWLALFIGVVVGIAFGLGLLVFVSLLKKRLKGKRSASRCLGDNAVIQQEITCLQDDVIFRRSSSNFSFWNDLSDCTEERHHSRSSGHEALNAANMVSAFASNLVASKSTCSKSSPVTFALVEQNSSPMVCDEMRVKLNQVPLDVLKGTAQTHHVFT